MHPSGYGTNNFNIIFVFKYRLPPNYKKTLKKQVDPSYSKAPKRLGRLRSIQHLFAVINVTDATTTLRHLLHVNPLGKTISSDVILTTGPTLTAQIQLLLERWADIIQAVCRNRLLVLHQFNYSACFWNVNSLAKDDTVEYKDKCRIISSHAQKGPVLLAETRWGTQAGGMRLAQAIGGSNVFSNPAVLVDTHGLSGGVAIVVPTHWMPGKLHWEIIVPGYVASLTREFQEHSQTWVVAYLRPGYQRDPSQMGYGMAS